MEIKGSVIFVTGSASRVGRTIALELAKKNGKVVIHYHTNRDKAEQTAGEIFEITGQKPLIVSGDLSVKKNWLNVREAILNSYGRIDVLVNNAAIFYRTPFFQIKETDWDKFLAVNLKSVFLGCQVLGEQMLKQKRGKIINIADVSAYSIWENYIPYCISKSGVIDLTKGLAKALAPYVTVNAVAPGTVLLADKYDPEEEQYLINKTPLKRIGTPEDIARTVAFLIEGSDFINGAVINVDGGRSLT